MRKIRHLEHIFRPIGKSDWRFADIHHLVFRLRHKSQHLQLHDIQIQLIQCFRQYHGISPLHETSGNGRTHSIALYTRQQIPQHMLMQVIPVRQHLIRIRFRSILCSFHIVLQQSHMDMILCLRRIPGIIQLHPHFQFPALPINACLRPDIHISFHTEKFFHIFQPRIPVHDSHGSLSGKQVAANRCAGNPCYPCLRGQSVPVSRTQIHFASCRHSQVSSMDIKQETILRVIGMYRISFLVPRRTIRTMHPRIFL